MKNLPNEYLATTVIIEATVRWLRAVAVRPAIRSVALRERQLPVTHLTIDLRSQQTTPTFELPQKCLKISSDTRCPNQSFGDRKSSSLFERYGMLGGNFCEVTESGLAYAASSDTTVRSHRAKCQFVRVWKHQAPQQCEWEAQVWLCEEAYASFEFIMNSSQQKLFLKFAKLPCRSH